MPARKEERKKAKLRRGSGRRPLTAELCATKKEEEEEEERRGGRSLEEGKEREAPSALKRLTPFHVRC